MLAGKYYRIKYKFIEAFVHFFFISFKDSLKIFFLRREDKNIYDDKKYSHKTPYISSNNQKIAVVIDDTVPRYDIYAGAKTLMGYIKIYKDMGYTVKFLPDDFISREPYVSYMEKELDVEVLCGKWWKKNHLKWLYSNRENIAFVMLNAPRSIAYIEYLKKYIKTKVIYYDMDMYSVREKTVFATTKEKKHYRASQYYEKVEKKLFNLSDAVITISEKETEEIHKITNKNNIYTLPCYIYDKFNKINYDVLSRKDILFVGGQKELANTDGIAWFCSEIFPVIFKENPEIKFNIVGLHDGMFVKKYQNKNIIFHGKVSEEKLAEIYNSVRIAVAPLRFGAGVKAKVIEAMYYGVPMVSTCFGTEGLRDVDSFITVQNDAAGFADAVLKLYNDKEKLADMSVKANEYSRKYFSYEYAKNIFGKII